MHRYPIDKLEITPYPEFEMHHVIPLKPIGSWSVSDLKIQLETNRIFQPSFLVYDPNQLINALKTCNQGWATDFAAMTPQAALYMHICAELITAYQVNPNDANALATKIYEELRKKPDIFQFADRVTKQLADEKDKIMTNAKKALDTQYPTLKSDSDEYKQKLDDFVLLEMTKMSKQLTDKELLEFAPDMIETVTRQMGIEKKPTVPHKDNIDYVFLGAAASGKTSISKLKINVEHKNIFAIVATDEYRGFHLPGTAAHEMKKTHQVLTRTQDTAYLIKEIVLKKLDARKDARPNIIFDGITFDKDVGKLFVGNQETHYSMACMSDVKPIPQRAFMRAETATDVADRWRHINTTTLLSGHKSSSTYLLSNLPPTCVITMYDTNIIPDKKFDNKPILLGSISTNSEKKQNNLEIFDIVRMANFVGKANINVSADFPGTLYYNENKEVKKYRFTYDNFYKAEQILNLANTDHNFTVTIHDEKIRCLSISKSKDPTKGLDLRIIDENAFAKMLSANTKKSHLTKSLIITLAFGKEARNNIHILGKKAAFISAMQKLNLEKFIFEATPELSRRIKSRSGE